MNGPSVFGAWVAASRPATLPAAAGPVAVGTAIAHVAGGVHLGAAFAALAGAVTLQIGTNLVNDVADFYSGADTEARLGPARATQKGWLSARRVTLGAVLCFAATFAIGSYLVWLAGWPIFWLGVASIVSGILYTAGPWPLGYHGLGDLFVWVFFGFGAVAGTAYVQRLSVPPEAWWAGAAVGALATAILVVNNLRDRSTDATVGKRTLVVRFGDRFGRLQFAVSVAAAYLLLAGAALSGVGHGGWWLPWLSAPFALVLVRRLWTREGAALNPLLGATARLGLGFNVLLALGICQ
jgi:1,4-dihydroxy-2-naphthoate polyprenyltransferase